MDTSPAGTRESTEGTIIEVMPNALFTVQLSAGEMIIARIAGTLPMRGLRIVPGDRVEVELSPYDHSRGRIIKRLP